MKTIFTFYCLAILISCTAQQKADLLVYNAKVYTVDSLFTTAEAFAVLDGKIIDVGKTSNILLKFESKVKLDAHGNCIFPGFIDAHSHFIQYGLTLRVADLVGTGSWKEILSKLQAFAAVQKEG